MLMKSVKYYWNILLEYYIKIYYYNITNITGPLGIVIINHIK